MAGRRSSAHTAAPHATDSTKRFDTTSVNEQTKDNQRATLSKVDGNNNKTSRPTSPSSPSPADFHSKLSAPPSRYASPISHLALYDDAVPTNADALHGSVATTTQTTAPAPATAPDCAASAPRVPLSTIVHCLVEEWSRSYTALALQGDTEAMCMLAQGHFSRVGYGCIPHDAARGYEWLARAKQSVADAAAADAKRCGRKPCTQAIGVKAQAIERDCLEDNVFEVDEHTMLDDVISEGSIASLGSFSCDAEGTDTMADNHAALLDAMQLPPETDAQQGSGANAMESDGWGYAHTPAHARSSSVRNSLSHPNLSGELSKAWRSPAHNGCNSLQKVRGGVPASPTPIDESLPPTEVDTSLSLASVDEFVDAERDDLSVSMESEAGSSVAPSTVGSEADSPHNASGSQHRPLLRLHASQDQLDSEQYAPIAPAPLRRCISAEY